MTAAADARRATIVARAMAREGLAATLTRPAQAGPGSGLSGGVSAAAWDVTVIRLPLELRARDSNSTLAEADGRVVVQSLEVAPQNAWTLTYNSTDHYIIDVETIPSGSTDVCYICAVQGGE